MMYHLAFPWRPHAQKPPGFSCFRLAGRAAVRGRNGRRAIGAAETRPGHGAESSGDHSQALSGDGVFPRAVGAGANAQYRRRAFSDDLYVLAGMVDNSGYSTGIREKYQAYLLTEVPLQIGGQKLPPGAYGMGFVDGGKFVVLDLGANDLLAVSSSRDAEMKRPVPLQVVAAEGVKYRLYMGRDFVEFRRMK